MNQGAENGIEDSVQMFTQVVGEETKHKIAVLLKAGILAAIASVGFGV